MLILNKDKENLLVEKYGFEKYFILDEYVNAYRFNKSLTIYSSNHKKWACQVEFKSMSRAAQDILYDLIKDDVLIKVPNVNKEEMIERLQNKIIELQNRIKKLEQN